MTMTVTALDRPRFPSGPGAGTVSMSRAAGPVGFPIPESIGTTWD
jgi:hypothetical protein